MKPCSKNRKLLAWLALGELDARRAGALRAHIQSCEGCRRYLAEISTVTQSLAPAETHPDIQASASFHQRLVTRLRAEQPASLWETVAGLLATARLNWRMALPVFGAAALVIATLILVRQPAVSPPAPISVQAVSPPAPKRDLAPTIANYDRVANRSLEELDDLLTRQANRNPPPAPIYTASMVALANAAD
jgi:anti-sigma factor RsiW